MIVLPLLVVLLGVEGKYHRPNGCDISIDTCVVVLDRCGEFPAQTSNLTIIGLNFDGECLVARLGSTRQASCKGVHLIPASDGICNHTAVAKLDERNMVWIVFTLLHMALMILGFGALESRGVFWAGVLFWWSDFWAGLFWNLLAAVQLTSGIDDPVRSFMVSLVCGLVLEEVCYDLPLKVIKECIYCDLPLVYWIWAVSIFGFLYIGGGIYFAYSSSVVVLVGHHAILYGIAQWVADILKAVVKKHVCDCVCQRPQKGTYQLMISELAEPLPESSEVP